jgi:hypothetical protein
MAGDANEKVEGESIVPWVGHGLGNWPTRGWPMDMEISLACSSIAAATALFAVSFFSLSALPRILVCRCSTSAAHLAFVQPGGLSFGARGFLAFGAPSSAIFFGGMLVERERRSCNCGGMADFGGENGYMRRTLEEK